MIKIFLCFLFPFFLFADDYGNIPSNLDIPAGHSVRRNSGDTAFESYLPSTGGGGDGATSEAELEAALLDVTNVYTNNDGNLNDDDVSEADVRAHESALVITESQISDLSHTVDTNASTICSGSHTYLDGAGNCDTLDGLEDFETATNNNILIGNGTTFLSKAIPDCDDTAGQHLNYDTTGREFTCGSSTSYTTELAQDAFGAMIVDTAEIDLTYDDATPFFTASIITGSIDESKLDTSTNASLNLADSALQSGDNISLLTNDSGYLTSAPVASVNSLTGTVVLDADDIDDTSTTNKFVTATDITKLSNLSGTNTGDQDLTELVKGQITLPIGNKTDVITPGAKEMYLRLPYDGTITGAEVVCDQSGSIVVDIWKDTYANFPPTDADSICASDCPTVSSAIKSTDSVLTGWTTTFSTGDYLEVNVDSASTATFCVLTLTVTKG